LCNWDFEADYEYADRSPQYQAIIPISPLVSNVRIHSLPEHIQGQFPFMGMHFSIPCPINGLTSDFTFLSLDWASSLKDLSFPKNLDGFDGSPTFPSLDPPSLPAP
jgi:hypothetical protein